MYSFCVTLNYYLNIQSETSTWNSSALSLSTYNDGGLFTLYTIRNNQLFFFCKCSIECGCLRFVRVGLNLLINTFNTCLCTMAVYHKHHSIIYILWATLCRTQLLNNPPVYSVFAKVHFLHILCFLPISVDLVSWDLRLRDEFDIEQLESCFVAVSCDRTAVSQVQTPRDLKYVSGTSNLLYYWCGSWLVMDSKKGTFHQASWLIFN